MTGAGVVIFDLDKGLADMSSYAWMLAAQSDAGDAWQRFYSHVEQAAVVEAGRDIVWTVAELGFTVVYSTSRPFSTAATTRRWLDAHAFPRPAALYSRLNKSATTSALLDKVHHCELVRQRIRHGYLAAFVDDDPEVVAQLHAEGLPGIPFDRLQNLARPEVHQILTDTSGLSAITDRKV